MKAKWAVMVHVESPRVLLGGIWHWRCSVSLCWLEQGCVGECGSETKEEVLAWPRQGLVSSLFFFSLIFKICKITLTQNVPS